MPVVSGTPDVVTARRGMGGFWDNNSVVVVLAVDDNFNTGAVPSEGDFCCGRDSVCNDNGDVVTGRDSSSSWSASASSSLDVVVVSKMGGVGGGGGRLTGDVDDV